MLREKVKWRKKWEKEREKETKKRGTERERVARQRQSRQRQIDGERQRQWEVSSWKAQNTGTYGLPTTAMLTQIWMGKCAEEKQTTKAETVHGWKLAEPVQQNRRFMMSRKQLNYYSHQVIKENNQIIYNVGVRGFRRGVQCGIRLRPERLCRGLLLP